MSSFDGDPEGCPGPACGARRPDEGWGTLLGGGDLVDRRYRVERPLAVGGAGITYLAREVDDAGQAQGPLLAVKVLYQARAAGPFLKRLTTEFSVLQELAHPNIVELRGFVTRAGQEPYLVTRFEEGGNLSQHVDRHGPLPPRAATGILRQVLLALETAHARGVVHRDLKPDNVLLRAPVGRDAIPEVRVADFGIAKVVGAQLHGNVTRAGAFVGTPEYAAPEQFLGQPPTPATDLFAAGGLLYFLLTARPPFLFRARQDVDQCLTELLEQLPVALLPSRDATPEEQRLLQHVLDLTMRESAGDRSTVPQVLQTLRPLLEPPPPGAPAPARPAPISWAPPSPTPPRSAADPSLADAPLPRLPSRSGTPAPTGDRAARPPAEDAPDARSPVERTVDFPNDESSRPAGRPVPAPTLEPEPGPAEPPTAAPPPAPAVSPPDPSSTGSAGEGRSIGSPAPPSGSAGRSVPAATPRPAVRASAAGTRATVVAAGAAGCMGLSLVSTAALALVGLVVVAAALAVAAVLWQPVRFSGPIEVPVDDRVARFEQASPLGPNGTLRVQRQVAEAAPELARRCGHPARVDAELLVSPSGQVLYARVGEGGLGRVDPRCLEENLETIRLDAPPRQEGVARVEIVL